MAYNIKGDLGVLRRIFSRFIRVESLSGNTGNVLAADNNGEIVSRNVDFFLTGSTIFNNKVNNSTFYAYTSATNTLIGTKLNISDFSSYSANTQNTINNNYSQFTGFTNNFYDYTSATNTLIGTKLDTAIFANYTANTGSNVSAEFSAFTQTFYQYTADTNNLINTKLDKTTFTAFTNSFYSYSSNTLNTINNNYSQFTGFTNSFNSYSANTNALIGTKLDTSVFTAFTNNFYGYTANTQNTINNNYSDFTAFTNSFYGYTGDTNNLINTKLNISDFNSYSANTLNTINNNYSQFTGFTNSFNSYSANTQNQLNNKYDKSGGTISGNVTINGNLIVNGTATTINTQNLLVYDPIIGLALVQSGSTNPTLDSGFIIERGLSGNTGFIWKESNKQFELGYTNNTYNDINVNISQFGDLKVGGLKTNYIYDSLSSTGLTNYILTTTPTGIKWLSGTTTVDISGKLDVSAFTAFTNSFYSYSSNTQNTINNNYNQFTAFTNSFNSYSANTRNTINNNYSQFTAFTNSFYSYSSNTQNTINNNYNQFTAFTNSFNSYSANTRNTINNNYSQFTAFTNSFYSYSSNTQNTINNNYRQFTAFTNTFYVYSAQTDSRLLFSSGTVGSTFRVNNNNEASGQYSTVSGGQNNKASGNNSFIGGGYCNTSTGVLSSIVGGRLNTSSGSCSFIGGGYSNYNGGDNSLIGGGTYNTSSGNCSFIGGGTYNTSSGNCSFIGGGGYNTSLYDNTTIGGGYSNFIESCDGSIGGGMGNFIINGSSTIGGGIMNAIGGVSTFLGCWNGLFFEIPEDVSACFNFNDDLRIFDSVKNKVCCSTVSNSYYNPGTSCTYICLDTPIDALGTFPLYNKTTASSVGNEGGFIGGGIANVVSGNKSFIGGGNRNTVNGENSTISGGFKNTANGDYSTISGGYLNTTSGAQTFIGGGRLNTSSGYRSIIGGGGANTASGQDSIIGGGYGNTASGTYSFIGGGIYNAALGNSTFILGSNITGTLDNTTYVENLNVKNNIYDSFGTTGTTGYLLSTTPTGVKWVSGATSTSLTPNFDYIDFTTGYTATAKTGRVYYDSTEQALSYFPNTPGMDVTVNIGQESLVRVYNSTGAQINNGSVVHISGSTGGLPTIVLANASDDARAEIGGVATHDIPNNSIGFITYFGIVRDVNTSAFNVGDELYLSDTINGGFTNNVIGINFSSRVCSVGWVITSGTTNGKILVSITNENKVQSLTNKEVNILLGNTISTGVFEFTGLTKTSNTTFQIAPVKAWFVDNTSNPIIPYVLQVNYSGSTTGQTTPYLTTSDATYVLMTSAGTISYQKSFPSPQERRQNIFLGKVVHPSRTSILNINNTVDFDVSPMSALRDLWTPIKGVNQGIIVSPHSTTLEINTSAGVLWGNGIGWTTNQLNPNSVSIPGKAPATFAYRTQTGGTTGEVSLIDVGNYDVGGAVTPIPGTQYTTQRVYQFPTGLIRIQYGQNYYSTLAKALAALTTETFVEYVNNRDNGILIGLITVASNASNLSNTNQAIFTLVSKFGEVLTGTAGGLATTTLQQAYDNSTQPEILTDSTLGAMTFRRGSAAETDRVIEVQNISGVNTFAVTGLGDVSGNSFNVKTYIYDSTNTSGTTNQVLFTSPSGVRWNNIDGIVTGYTSSKLNITDFSSYSANTLTSINNNYSQFTGFTNSFNSYSANTLTSINNKVIEGGSGILSTVRINANNITSGNYSGVLSGTGNTASGTYSVIAGGRLNIVTGSTSFIGGGCNNSAIGNSSFVGGGNRNISSGNSSFVGGGELNNSRGDYSVIGGGSFNNITSATTYSGIFSGSGNTTTGLYTFIGGGCGNTACVGSDYSVIGGGLLNSAIGNQGFIGGGLCNRVISCAGTVAGGWRNTSSAYNGFIGGGFNNSTCGGGPYSSIAGGATNTTSSWYSVIAGGGINSVSGTYRGIVARGNSIVGGRCNTINTQFSAVTGFNYIGYSSIGGGFQNTNTATFSSIGGGWCNSLTSNFSFIGGGISNTLSGAYTVIGGGMCNIASGVSAVIGGGCLNIASNTCATIGGGRQNTASNCHATISGGRSGTASGQYTTIGGGYVNTVISNYSTISGGYCNAITGSLGCSFIGGGRNNTASNPFSSINGGCFNTAQGESSFIGGGILNVITGSPSSSIISGGRNNTLVGPFSTIVGGTGNTVTSTFGNILGGRNNTTACNNSFILGSNITANAIDTTFTQCINACGQTLLQGTSASSGCALLVRNSTPLALYTALNTGQHLFNGTFTATANNTCGWNLNQTLTQRGTGCDTLYATYINPTIIYAQHNQTNKALSVQTLFTGTTLTWTGATNIIADFGATNIGTQLTVSDVISGTIYGVNDVSGLPIIDATSNWDVNIYDFPNRVFAKTNKSLILGVSGNSASTVTVQSDLIFNEGIGLGYRMSQVSGLTTGSSVSVLYQLAIPTGQTVFLTANTLGRANNANMDSTISEYKYTAKRSLTGSLTQVGVAQGFVNRDNNNTNVGIDISSNNIRLVVTGNTDTYLWASTIIAQTY